MECNDDLCLNRCTSCVNTFQRESEGKENKEEEFCSKALSALFGPRPLKSSSSSKPNRMLLAEKEKKVKITRRLFCSFHSFVYAFNKSWMSFHFCYRLAKLKASSLLSFAQWTFRLRRFWWIFWLLSKKRAFLCQGHFHWFFIFHSHTHTHTHTSTKEKLFSERLGWFAINGMLLDRLKCLSSPSTNVESVFGWLYWFPSSTRSLRVATLIAS